MTIVNSEKIIELKCRWNDLLKDYDSDRQVSRLLIEEIISAYSESHRYYHTLSHLSQLFKEMDLCEAVTSEMLWAVWYHDFVYKPGSKENEKKSAIQAEKSMQKLGVTQSSINKVVALILATETHQIEADDIETQIFLDADMAIIGSDEVSYRKYCKAIRREHSNIPSFLFKRGRKKFLLSVLKKKVIFKSSFFNKKYEIMARKNIESEIRFLDKKWF